MKSDMFDSNNLSCCFLNRFIHYAEATTWGQSVKLMVRECDQVHTAELLEHLICIGEIIFGHCDSRVRKLLKMRQVGGVSSVGRQLE